MLRNWTIDQLTEATDRVKQQLVAEPGCCSLSDICNLEMVLGWLLEEIRLRRKVPQGCESGPGESKQA